MDSSPSSVLLGTAISGTLDTMTETPTNALSSAVTRASDVAEAQSSSWLGYLAWLLFWILYYVVKLAISVPTIMYNIISTILSTSLTVTMNATTVLVIVAVIFGIATWYFRYRYLNMYSRLPPEPQRKEPDVDLFPETQEGGIKSGLASYFDEFLSAIKIFGYLERPVFHELTRSMQTKKIIAGEHFNLEDEKGFCLVVDGLVQIYVKSARNNQNSSSSAQHSCQLDPADSDDNTYSPSYQLLTEVRNGAPMSSMFSIMSLFTEDIQMNQSDDDNSEPGTAAASAIPPEFPLSPGFRDSRDTPISLPGTPNLEEPRGERVTLPAASPGLSNIPPMSLDSGAQTRPHRPAAKRMSTNSAHPDILAVAMVDTTIAIIPASAFRRLIRIFPKATAHIVHVILSRFQRVTLATAYNYLGLTGEVLQLERNMLKYTTRQLPNHLRGDALDRLKEKFSRERERLGEKDLGKGIALHNAYSHRRRRSASTLRKEAAFQAFSRQRHQSLVTPTFTVSRDMASLDSPSPGDLLGSTLPLRSTHQRPTSVNLNGPQSSQFNLSRDNISPLSQRAFNPFSTQRKSHVPLDKRETLDEDNMFRESILECMFRAIGLNGNSTTNRESEWGHDSPRLGSMDPRRQKPVLNNAFGFMEAFEGLGDGDTESMTSGGFNPMMTLNAHQLAQDMREEVEIVFFPKDSVLVEQGERNPGLYYVIDGFLDVCTQDEQSSPDILRTSAKSRFTPSDSTESLGATNGGMPYSRFGTKTSPNDPDGKKPKAIRRSVCLIKPGGLAGYVGTISSYRSFIEVVAKTDVYVGFLPLSSIEKIVDRHPTVLLTMAKRLTNLLPRLLLHIDFALEWLQVNAGQVLFNKGDESEAIHIVLNGRLRLVEDRKDGGMNVKAEFGQGDSVGELEVLTESSRSGTLHAIRDTELVKFPRTLFNSLAKEHPNITIRISKIIASRMRTLVDDPSTVLGLKGDTARSSVNKGSSTLNLRTVAILPVTARVPVDEFGARLMKALAQVGPPNGATSLNQAAIFNHLGKHAFNKMGKLKLSQYLADLEEKYGLVVYICDTSVTSPWTQTCITQADCVLLVGLADASPEMGEYERFMLGMKSTARKILILLHQERYSNPGVTRRWLKNRMWINGGHFHIQMPYSLPDTMPLHPHTKQTKTSLKQRVQTLQAEIQKFTSRKSRHSPSYFLDAPFKGDFHRLARRLCGKSVGLVLGGGGARGIAQIGIIRAMEEAGIPIDMVGGTSIGAYLGALYARHADVVPIFGLAKKFAGRMSSMWRFALDVTYPSASYTTGHEFNRGIFKTLGESQIEDFWLEYYCNTTNISKSRAEFHTSGYAWRYVRASMSLAGLLPPLCDEGSMLLDGGYIDNLTVSHMKQSLGADVIFAIDVGALDDDTPQQFGDTLSGFWAFVNRWNPFSSVPNPPTLAEIQARLAYVSSVDALERAKMMAGCYYMRPPIDEYGTLDFGKFDEIYEVGYKYGKKFLQQLRDKGVLPLVEESTEAKKNLTRTMAPRRASI